MATIKSYSDLEQSKKLAEILPIESADICYVCGNIVLVSPTKYGDASIEELYKKHIIPAWSLAALLSVLPAGKSLIHGENTHKYKLINCLVDAEWHDNPIDACVEIIEKLNELNLL